MPHCHLADVADQVVQQIRSEKDSVAHRKLREFKGNRHFGQQVAEGDDHEGGDVTPPAADSIVTVLPRYTHPHYSSSEVEACPGFEHPAVTGVIYVTERATRRGFRTDSVTGESLDGWANFGQGAPEVGPIPNAPDRPKSVPLERAHFEYAPAAGIRELREAVARLYNTLYRTSPEAAGSQYTWENVCITPGGRAGLTRVAAAIGDVNVGYFLPEYTAYEQMLGVFRRFVPIPTPLDRHGRYRVDAAMLRKECMDRGLSVVMNSNPSNPTGQMVHGKELHKWVQTAREMGVTLVLDEFYSRYVYATPPPGNASHNAACGSDSHSADPLPAHGQGVSGARYVQDVNQDPVVIVDGLTKGWRCPGWRVCWIVGPRDLIASMQSSGSFLEGGANHPLQVAAIPMLDPAFVRADTLALQEHFCAKRNRVLTRLAELHLPVECPPISTFYVWLNVAALPPPLDNGLGFFEALLDYRVIVVPGIFFDINPGKRRDLFASPYHHYVRLSFGPPLADLERGLDSLARMLVDVGYLSAVPKLPIPCQKE